MFEKLILKIKFTGKRLPLIGCLAEKDSRYINHRDSGIGFI